MLLWIHKSNAPYVITKPLHYSQKVLSEDNTGIIVSLNLKINYEFERLILGFGECIKVISPENLKVKIKENLKNALKNYE